MYHFIQTSLMYFVKALEIQGYLFRIFMFLRNCNSINQRNWEFLKFSPVK